MREYLINPEGRPGETPNPKNQAPDKSQAPSSKTPCRAIALRLEFWSFFGFCSLVFGVLIHDADPVQGREFRDSRSSSLRQSSCIRGTEFVRPLPGVVPYGNIRSSPY